MTPVYRAAENGHADVVKQLVGAGADVDQAMTTDGVTPLFVAAENGFVGVIKVLLAAGADINKANTNAFGYTPVYTAAQNGRLEVVRTLLENNADPNIPSKNGAWTPLKNALDEGHTAVAELLRKHGATLTFSDRCFLTCFFCFGRECCY